VGIEVYYPADIRNALLAAEQAVGATADAAGDKDDPFTTGFLTGYRAALTTLALAFGLVQDSQVQGASERQTALLAVAWPSLRQR
jgi:hypothetical protein